MLEMQSISNVGISTSDVSTTTPAVWNSLSSTFGELVTVSKLEGTITELGENTKVDGTPVDEGSTENSATALVDVDGGTSVNNSVLEPGDEESCGEESV